MKTIQQRLAEIDYSFNNYKPSLESLMFIEFIKKVNEDSGGLEHESPLIHYKIADLLFRKDCKYKAVMAFRGGSKTTLVEYQIMYGMCFNKMFGMDNVRVGMYVANSMKDGAKQLRQNIENKIRSSKFLQEMIPVNKIKVSANENTYNFSLEENNKIDELAGQGMNFTDMALQVVNKDGKPFYLKLFGVFTGIRGFRQYDIRPQFCICHVKGTEVFTDMGIHKVEDYHTKLPSRFEKGLEIKLCGLTKIEKVTLEHKYLTASIINTVKKEYLEKYKKNISTKGKTKTTTSKQLIEPRWIKAQNLEVSKKLGCQRTRKDYLVKPIDYSIKKPEPFLYSKAKIVERNEKGHPSKIEYFLEKKIHKHIKHPSFWYLYGLYLSDGTTGKGKISFVFDNNKQWYIDKFLEHCNKLGYKAYCHMSKHSNCQIWSINDTALSRYHKSNHLGNSIKFIPEWVLYQPIKLQKQLLLGYIAGDGYINYERNQIRINSVNEDAINKLGFICERLGLPYHIRMTRSKQIKQYICSNTKESISQKQWEIRLSQNVKKILKINIKDTPSNQVFIKDNCLYRKIKWIKYMNKKEEFIPIKTPSHTYITQFGLSHNCDDLLKDSDARSETVTKSIEEVIYRAIPYALHPHNFNILWLGTPYNSKDPLYKALESDTWKSVILPVAEKFPCKKEEFKGAWEERFSYDDLIEKWNLFKMNGNEQGFRQEMMLQIIPEEGLLVPPEKIIEIPSETFKTKPKNNYNFYITTDFAYTDKESSDYSVISVWAVNNNGDYILCDGYCGKALIDTLINKLFEFNVEYKPLQIGFEITGQQIGFVNLIRNEMIKRNNFFMLKEIRPIKDKFSRFNLATPLFHQEKIMICSNMMKNQWGIEFTDEIAKATIEGFKSKHDDVLDTISMLLDLDVFQPSISDHTDNKKSLGFKYNPKSNLIF